MGDVEDEIKKGTYSEVCINKMFVQISTDMESHIMDISDIKGFYDIQFQNSFTTSINQFILFKLAEQYKYNNLKHVQRK